MNLVGLFSRDDFFVVSPTTRTETGPVGAGGGGGLVEEEGSGWVDMVAIGECRNEIAEAGKVGDSGDEEFGVVVGVADTGEGARVFGIESPNPSVLRVRCESTVSEVCWGIDFYDCFANDTR